MAKRAFIIPRRNDIAGMNIHIGDLFPNTSQHNSIYDGEGQTGYLHYSYDQPGATVLVGGTYSSGSLTTTVANALSADKDTNSAGGVDSRVTVLTEYGLQAYLREHINKDAGGGANTVTSAAEAIAIAGQITARVDGGQNIDAAALNAIVIGLVVAADFDGLSVANSNSFGSVEDIMRILAGESYVVPANTILTANGNGQVFKTLAQRKVLVAAAVAAGNTQYVAQGHFLASTEPGYRPIKSVVMSGHVKASSGEGQLAGFKTAISLKNPVFDYTGLTALPVAKKIGAGGAIPATGIWNILAVYDSDGKVC